MLNTFVYCLSAINTDGWYYVSNFEISFKKDFVQWYNVMVDNIGQNIITKKKRIRSTGHHLNAHLCINFFQEETKVFIEKKLQKKKNWILPDSKDSGKVDDLCTATIKL